MDNQLPTPKLPERDMSSVQFFVLGALLHGLKSGRDLMSTMERDYGWDLGPRKITALKCLQRFEEMGLITKATVNTENVYQLTELGEAKWIAEFDFRQAQVSYWRQFRHDKFPKRPKGTPLDRVPIFERGPTAEERQKILECCRPSFRRFCEFMFLTNARATDLMCVQIPNVDFDNGVLYFEPATYGGRAITKRDLPFGEEGRRILREAIGRRTTGFVFLNSQKKPWTGAHISAKFRKARDSAGVSADVVMSGRGGRIGTILAEGGGDMSKE